MKKKIFTGILVGSLILGSLSLFAGSYARGNVNNAQSNGKHCYHHYGDCYDHRWHNASQRQVNGYRVTPQPQNNYNYYCDYHNRWEYERCPYNQWD